MRDVNKLIDKSEIYMVTCNITSKRYIGQVACYYMLKGRPIKAGHERRFKNHIDYANGKVKGQGARCLIDSIRKYGADNHSIKPIWICPTVQADYWEVKYIRQYNTQIPNGLNIMKGGKKCALEAETKIKISEARKGKWGGEKNPMWGKHHSEETREKIRRTQIGKILPSFVRENMSKAHIENMKNGQLPPRRKHNELPKYIYYVQSAEKYGYEIRHHPKLKQKQFVSKVRDALPKNLERAKKYLEDVDNPNNQKQQKEDKEYKDLPRYVRHVRSENFEGFEVKFHPNLANKKWTSRKLTMEQKLELAKKYLDEGSETKSLSVDSYESA